MSHVDLDQLENQFGYRSPSSTLPDLEKSLKEFQGWRQEPFVGVASGSAVSMLGIAPEDTIIGCIGLTNGGTFNAAAASVTLGGDNIEINTNNTTGLGCLLTWLDKDGFQGLP